MPFLTFWRGWVVKIAKNTPFFDIFGIFGVPKMTDFGPFLDPFFGVPIGPKMVVPHKRHFSPILVISEKGVKKGGLRNDP